MKLPKPETMLVIAAVAVLVFMAMRYTEARIPALARFIPGGPR